MNSSSRPRRCAPHGFTLIEAMISLTVLAIALMGIMQVQILAANQNGLARRTAQAAAIARDFAETAQRWPDSDPRLATTVACAASYVGFPVTEQMLGNAKAPAVKFDFTATPAGPYATAEATTSDALTLNGATYDGLAPRMLTMGGVAGGELYQVLWSVRRVDTNTNQSGCEALLVNVAVRFPTGSGDNYRSIVTTVIKYNSNMLLQNGLSEAI